MSAVSQSACDCPEVRARPPAFYRFRDCDYCRRRKRLIQLAEKDADARVVVRAAIKDRGESAKRWTLLFAIKMEALAAPLLNGGKAL